jgi:hypothetical protein
MMMMAMNMMEKREVRKKQKSGRRCDGEHFGGWAMMTTRTITATITNMAVTTTMTTMMMLMRPPLSVVEHRGCWSLPSVRCPHSQPASKVPCCSPVDLKGGGGRKMTHSLSNGNTDIHNGGITSFNENKTCCLWDVCVKPSIMIRHTAWEREEPGLISVAYVARRACPCLKVYQGGSGKERPNRTRTKYQSKQKARKLKRAVVVVYRRNVVVLRTQITKSLVSFGEQMTTDDDDDGGDSDGDGDGGW